MPLLLCEMSEPGVQNDDSGVVLEQRQQLSIDLVLRRPTRHANVVLDAPADRRLVCVATAAAARVHQTVERFDEAVVSVRVFADN